MPLKKRTNTKTEVRKTTRSDLRTHRAMNPIMVGPPRSRAQVARARARLWRRTPYTRVPEVTRWSRSGVVWQHHGAGRTGVSRCRRGAMIRLVQVALKATDL